MEEAKAGFPNPESKEIMKDQEMKDIRYPKDTWMKCNHTHESLNAEKPSINVYWWQNKITGESHGYKFKGNLVL